MTDLEYKLLKLINDLFKGVPEFVEEAEAAAEMGSEVPPFISVHVKWEDIKRIDAIIRSISSDEAIDFVDCIVAESRQKRNGNPDDQL